MPSLMLVENTDGASYFAYQHVVRQCECNMRWVLGGVHEHHEALLKASSNQKHKLTYITNSHVLV